MTRGRERTDEQKDIEKKRKEGESSRERLRESGNHEMGEACFTWVGT